MAPPSEGELDGELRGESHRELHGRGLDHPAAMNAAARSPMAIAVRLVGARVIRGMIEASATRRFSIPWTLRSSPTTASASSAGPMRHVPTGWYHGATTAR